jgi:GNAT superfamily N-acetyltransferase
LDYQTAVGIEQLSLSAWPALRTVFFDGWVMRFSEGYTKRSNSVVPLYPGTLNLDRKVGYSDRMYKERNLPTIFKLMKTPSLETLDEYLSRADFECLDETMVETCSLSRLPSLSTDCLHVQDGFSSEWVNGFFHCSGLRDLRKQATARALLASIAEKVISVRKFSGERTTGCGFGVVQDQNVGLFDISVHEDFRRQGIATQIVGSLLEKAKSMGAATSYLQVVADNEPARRLYAKFGYREAYRYWYRIKPCRQA